MTDSVPRSTISRLGVRREMQSWRDSSKNQIISYSNFFSGLRSREVYKVKHKLNSFICAHDMLYILQQKYGVSFIV